MFVHAHEQLGDAKAFRVVWDHFGALQTVLDEEGGALVKTIGDAVMAAFPTPDRAARAAIRMQRQVESLCGEGSISEEIGWDPRLKIGFADGPALVVNLNGRLDYFGGTVNLAARVQGKAGDNSVL
ncbi:MAG: adenylate/guanylate cyclase domain-containing protein, partial [Proteobacteria bacterium]|nr:adenylate/guanylate cyclase domain-containing protein [Pseudomonadota bacterium]